MKSGNICFHCFTLRYNNKVGYNEKHIESDIIKQVVNE